MTKEEAIKKMQAVKAYMISGNPIWSVTEMGEAFDMAIEALKQTQWIPCSERSPSEVGLYLTTIENIMGKASVISGFRNGIWQTQFDVIAWMPKPKPYMRGEEDV